MPRNGIGSEIQVAISGHVGATDDRRRLAASGGVMLDDPMYGDDFHLCPKPAHHRGVSRPAHEREQSRGHQWLR